jgi:diguanylate cyclase (GGDEF)-like protein
MLSPDRPTASRSRTAVKHAADAAAATASGNVVPLMPPVAAVPATAPAATLSSAVLPGAADPQHVVNWALAAVADAERRVAALEARISFLESLSVTDELTGLLNRRGFMTTLERALAAARRGAPGGVLVLCDLDGFKSVNDRFGHAAGDEVLRRVGTLLAGRIRRCDAAARLGGDEFTLLLAGACPAGARRKAEALARAVAEMTAQEAPVSVGLSFGTVPFTGGESEADLLKAADMAMYVEKRRRMPGRV